MGYRNDTTAEVELLQGPSVHLVFERTTGSRFVRDSRRDVIDAAAQQRGEGAGGLLSTSLRIEPLRVRVFRGSEKGVTKVD